MCKVCVGKLDDNDFVFYCDFFNSFKESWDIIIFWKMKIKYL